MSQQTIAQKDVQDLNDRLSSLATLRYYEMITAYEHDAALAVAIESVYPRLIK